MSPAAPVLCTMLLLAQGCRVTHVQPLPPGIGLVAIVENPRVIVPGFVDVMREAFRAHGIRTWLTREPPAGSVPVLTYTARLGWKFVRYLRDAELRVRLDGEEIAHAFFHPMDPGTPSVRDWQSVRYKMTPIYDQLLVNYPTTRR